MKKYVYVTTLMLGVLFSCNKSEKSFYGEPTEEAASEATSEELDSLQKEDSDLVSQVATFQVKDRKFKKLGEINMDVKEVYPSVKSIEKAVSQSGGYVTHSEIKNEILETRTVVVSKDSVNELKKNRDNATIHAKIPQQKLASFLIDIEKEIQYLNSRLLAADEVTFEYKWNDLSTQTSNNSIQKLNSSLQKGGNLNEEVNAIDKMDEKAEAINYGKFNKMKMDDDVKMAEINIQINGKEKVSSILVENLQNFNEARNPFWYDLSQGFKKGYFLFLNLVIGISYLWLFILVTIGLWVGIKYLKKKKLALKNF